MRIFHFTCAVFLIAGCAPSSIRDESPPGGGGGGAGTMCRFTALEDAPIEGGASRPTGSAEVGASFVTRWTSALGTAGVVDIAVDATGKSSDILIAGDAEGELDLGAGVKLQAPASGGGFVAKLDPLGDPAWVVAAPLLNLQVATDGDGGAWLTSMTEDDFLLLSHFDALGHEIARTRLPMLAPGQMVSSGDGGVILAGRTIGDVEFEGGLRVPEAPSIGGQGTGMVLVAFDPHGQARWGHTVAPLFWSDAPGSIDARGLNVVALAPAPGGGATILVDAEDVGSAPESCVAHATVLARFGGKGALLWSRRLPTIDYGDLAVDASGNTLITTTDGGVTLDLFDPGGHPRWATRFRFSGEPLRPLFDGLGNIILTGSFTGEVDFGGGPLKGSPLESRLFIAEISSDGGYLTSRTFAASSALGAGTRPLADDRGEAVAVHANGSLIFAGEYLGNLDLGAGDLPPVPVSASSKDVAYGGFLARISP